MPVATGLLLLLLAGDVEDAVSAAVDSIPLAARPPSKPRWVTAKSAGNAALHKPCVPSPDCSLLVDGSANPLRRPLRSGRGLDGQPNNTGINPGDGPLNNAAKFSDTASPFFINDLRTAKAFEVFLEKPRVVTEVVVFTYEGLGGHNDSYADVTCGPWTRRLRVRTKRATGPPSLFQSLFSSSGTLEQDVSFNMSVLGQKRILATSFLVNDTVTAVTVEWVSSGNDGVPATHEARSNYTNCRELSISEVKVMALPLAAAYTRDEADTLSVEDHGMDLLNSTRHGRGLVAVMPPAIAAAAVEIEAKQNISGVGAAETKGPQDLEQQHIPGNTFSGSNAASQAIILHGTPSETPLATTELAATNMLGHRGFLARSQNEGVASGGFALAWIAVVAITIFSTRCLFFSGTKYPSGFSYAHLTDESDPAPLADLGADWWVDNGNSSTSDIASAGDRQQFHIGSPDRSRSPSPVPLERSRSSETEPERELEPSSDHGELSRDLQVVPSRATPCASCAPEPATIGHPQRLPVQIRRTAGGMPGRVALLYASPLCYKDNRNRPVPMPQIPFQREWDILVQAYGEATVSLRESAEGRGRGGQCCRPGVAFSAQPLTAASLQRTLAPVAANSAAAVVHLSGHGARGSLVLEDGRGTAHLFSSEMLCRILELSSDPQGPPNGGVRLVILNACSLRDVGIQFVQGGVPHVICSSADLRDSASHVFLRNLYSNLFQGSTVARAFEAACVALRSNADVATQATADHFFLLPEEDAHNEILFLPETGAKFIASGVASNSQAIRNSSATSARIWAQGRDLTSLLSTAEGGSSTDCGEEGPFPHSSVETSSVGSRHADTTSGSDSDGLEVSRGLSSNAAETTSLLLPRRGIAPLRPGVREARRTRPVGSLPTDALSVTLAATRRRTVPRVETLGTAPLGRQMKMLTRRPPALPVDGPAAPLVLHTPFGRSVPCVPDDFFGRTVDSWSVLQLLSTRRAVVVCGRDGEEHGIGKSAVLDAVHRIFALQMGGVCVAVPLNSLSDVEAGTLGAGGWIARVSLAVRRAFLECREQWWPASSGFGTVPRPPSKSNATSRGTSAGTGGALRRRPLRGGSSNTSRMDVSRTVSSGFHALSDPIAVAAAMRELITEMAALSELCEARCQQWPAASSQILLLLDECDHLIQQKHFQDAVAELLQQCSRCLVVLSTQQRMVGTAGGQFKVVHHEVHGLPPVDAAKLFLRRAQRPLRWGEFMPAIQSGTLPPGITTYFHSQDPAQPLVYNAVTEEPVLRLVAAHPMVAAQRGNPRRLIKLASRLGPSTSFEELVPPQEAPPKAPPPEPPPGLPSRVFAAACGGLLP